MRKTTKQTERAILRAIKAMEKANELTVAALGENAAHDRWLVLFHLYYGMVLIKRDPELEYTKKAAGCSDRFFGKLEPGFRHEQAIFDAITFTLGHLRTPDCATILHRMISDLCANCLAADSVDVFAGNYSFLSFAKLEKVRRENPWLESLPVASE